MKKLLTYVGFCIIGIFTWHSLFHRSWPTPSLVSHARRTSLLKTTWHSFKSLHWDFQWRAAGERILKIAMSLVSPFLKHGVYLSTKPEKCHRTTLWNAGRFHVIAVIWFPPTSDNFEKNSWLLFCLKTWNFRQPVSKELFYCARMVPFGVWIGVGRSGV